MHLAIYRTSLCHRLSMNIADRWRRYLQGSRILAYLFYRICENEVRVFEFSKALSLLFALAQYIRRKIKIGREVLLFRKNLLILLALPVFLGFLYLYFQFPYVTSASLLALVVFILVWTRIEVGFGLLILALTLSPKISLFNLPSGAVPLYFSDILVLFIVITALLKSEGRKLVSSPLDIPILLYLIIAILSTLRGIMISTIDKPLMGFLYLLKRVEYVAIFYLVLNHVKNRKQIEKYMLIWMVAAFFLSLYGIYEHFHPLEYTQYSYRIYERGYFSGQANHFGGYLMLFISITLSFLLYAGKTVRRCWLAGLILLMFFPLLWTYSREAYFALVGAVAVLFALRDKRLLILFIVLLLLAPLILPSTVASRISSFTQSFSSNNPSHSSMANRLYNWRIALKSFPEFPFLGVGFGARQRAFYDNHFVLVLSEVGLIGLAAFLYMLLAIFRQTLRIFREEKEIYLKALALGVLAGFIGIVIQSAASVAFIITRIAGPFWFLLGMIVAFSGKEMNSWAQHKEL